MLQVNRTLLERRNLSGFTMVEIVIAMMVLGVFLLPLMQHFIQNRRFSLAARDSIIVNSHQTSCIEELRSLDYKDLSLEKGATFTRIIKKYSGKKVINRLNINTKIEIVRSKKIKMTIINIKSKFDFLRRKKNKEREISMRGYAFPTP